MGLRVKHPPCSAFKIRVLKSHLLRDPFKLSLTNWGGWGERASLAFTSVIHVIGCERKFSDAI